MSTKMKGTKNDLIVSLQTMAKAAQQTFPNKTLSINGKPVKTVDFVAMLQGQVTAMQNADALRTAWLRATAQNAEAYGSQIAPAIVGLKQYAGAMLGDASSEYATFGFATKKAKRTLTNKVAATAQALATRAARHTMGNKQRLAITGVVPTPATATATSSSATPSSVSTTSISSLNGASGVAH
jgi:hypothetical protein